jgi:serine phosphatase RsbU (regulator of sigma subunit)
MTILASTRVGQLHVETRHLPAATGGGGDIHDVTATPFGVRLLIGDVMGTGLAANHTGLTLLNAWRELACVEPSLEEIAARLHDVIVRSDQPDRFATALLMSFPGNEWAEVLCCGHPPPLLLRAGSAAFVEPSPAPPLGLLDLADAPCRTSMIPVADGDRLLLYTDGVSEARDRTGRFFPLAEHTGQALRAGDPRLLDTLMAGLDIHIAERVADDILLLQLTVGEPGPAAAE